MAPQQLSGRKLNGCYVSAINTLCSGEAEDGDAVFTRVPADSCRRAGSAARSPWRPASGPAGQGQEVRRLLDSF